jgi:hypothetical protein
MYRRDGTQIIADKLADMVEYDRRAETPTTILKPLTSPSA